jgi:hypothetical protein
MPLDDIPDTSTLPAGECFLLEDGDVVRIAQPRMSAADVAAFTDALPSVPGRAPVGPPSVLEASVGAIEGPPGTHEGPAEDQQTDLRDRVLEHFRAGDSLADITDLVAGTPAAQQRQVEARSSACRVHHPRRPGPPMTDTPLGVLLLTALAFGVAVGVWIGIRWAENRRAIHGIRRHARETWRRRRDYHTRGSPGPCCNATGRRPLMPGPARPIDVFSPGDRL